MEKNRANNNEDQDIFPSEIALNPMGPSDIQEFLKRLQEEIEAGKNLLSESVASSIEFGKTIN